MLEWSLIKEVLVWKEFLRDNLIIDIEMIKIKQIRSRIGRPKDQKLTLDALGLTKMNKVVEHNPTPQILGMIHKVKHLIKVLEK